MNTFYFLNLIILNNHFYFSLRNKMLRKIAVVPIFLKMVLSEKNKIKVNGSTVVPTVVKGLKNNIKQPNMFSHRNTISYLRRPITQLPMSPSTATHLNSFFMFGREII